MTLRVFACLVMLAPTLTAQVTPGDYVSYTRYGSAVGIHTISCEVRLTFYSEDILRVDFLPSPLALLDSSFVVVREPGNSLPVTVHESDSALHIASSLLRVQCRKYPLRLTFTDSSGRVLLAEPAAGGMAADTEKRRIRFLLNADDHFYGTGERGTSLDKRGQAFDSYNTQVGGYSTPLPTMNLNVPYLASTNGYALYIDNTYRGRFDLGASDTTIFSYTVSGGELSWYFIGVPTIQGQLERYTWLTGRQPLPPRWAFGFLQSKNRYQDEREARSIVRTMREKHFPCDALILDLAWFRHMGDLSWDTSRWPRHDTMVSDFLAQGFKTILITEPYVVHPSVNFAEADSLGYFAQDATGRTFVLDKWWSCGGCEAALLDLTDPTVQRWWWSKHMEAFGSQVAGIWTDLGEPERHPDAMIHALGPAPRIHNIYNLLWARTVFEGLSHLHPERRVVNLTRSGFAGIQRYGVLPWSGDVARSFEGLAVQIPMMLGMGMSGLAYHNSDIGGYARMPTTPELYVRWMQYGVFCPITRTHGAGETVRGSPTEPWQFGSEAEAICREFIRLRYRLLPYIYTYARKNYESGLPLARPLFFLDPSDPRLCNDNSSYMWGDAFLVSPIVEQGQTSKKLYLPGGNWFNFWTDELVQGGSAILADAPLDRIPLFVRSGSIIPMGPVMEYSDERDLDTLTLAVYPTDTGTASFTLYEDDGTTLAYQRDGFSLTTFTQEYVPSAKGPNLRLRAGPSQGSFAGKLKQRVYVFDVHGMAQRPAQILCNGVMLAGPGPQGGASAGREGFRYDEDTHRLHIQALCSTDSTYEVEVRFP